MGVPANEVRQARYFAHELTYQFKRYQLSGRHFFHKINDRMYRSDEQKMTYEKKRPSEVKRNIFSLLFEACADGHLVDAFLSSHRHRRFRDVCVASSYVTRQHEWHCHQCVGAHRPCTSRAFASILALVRRIRGRSRRKTTFLYPLLDVCICSLGWYTDG